jgi:hypothetical protein
VCEAGVELWDCSLQVHVYIVSRREGKREEDYVIPRKGVLRIIRYFGRKEYNTLTTDPIE